MARDFIKNQLEEGKVSLYDLVSVILFRETAEVVIEHEPCDYVLYNKLVEFREWTTHRPSGPGHYGPALDQAEVLLNRNRSGSCALGMFFVSDGRPSDPDKSGLPLKMGKLASRMGRRLTVTFVGMANQSTEDFSVLEQMTKEALEYGAVASFNKPSMDSDSLSQIISSRVASSLTSTKTELTNLTSGKSLIVRSDLIRERKDAPDDLDPTRDWKLFNSSQQYTVDVWTWNKKKRHVGGNNDFVRLIDPRCSACYSVVVMNLEGAANQQRGTICAGCKACFFCWDCIGNKRAGVSRKKVAELLSQRSRNSPAHPLPFSVSDTRDKCFSMMTARRHGEIIPHDGSMIPSFSVAWKRQCFGEGAERVAYKFRFVDDDGKFTGMKMVAKESRFVDDESVKSSTAKDYLKSRQHQYHVDFMRTQYLASDISVKYNRVLAEWEEFFLKKREQLQQNPFDPAYQQKYKIYASQLDRIRKFPRIRFLQPHVFELVDKVENRTFNVMVEPFLPEKFRKYNSNNGAIPSQQLNMNAPLFPRNEEGLNESLVDLLIGTKTSALTKDHTAITERKSNNGLGAIVEEESEEEDSDDDDSVENPNHPSFDEPTGVFEDIVQEGKNNEERKLSRGEIPDEDFVQAFSHFSYARCGGRLIVVDLQGCLEVKSDGSREFILTDPAIHKRRNSHRLRKMKFGRTDRGSKGIKDFFSTHECNDACSLLGLKKKTRKQSRFVS